MRADQIRGHMLGLPYQLGIVAISAILSGAVGFSYGYSRATDKYAPEIAQLKSAIQAGHEAVKIQQVKNTEAIHENRRVALDLAGRISAGADIDAARVRELSARSKALAAALAASPDRDISSTCQSELAGRVAESEIKLLELKGRCITDAAARVIIKDWALRIGLKPAQ